MGGGRGRVAGRASPEPSLPSSTDDQLSPSSARFWVNLRGRLALRICTRPGSLARHPHPRLARGTSSAACAHSSSSSRSSTALLGGGVRVRLGVHSSRRSSAAQTGAARSRKRRLSERATLARRAGRRGGFKSLGGRPRGPLCSLARALLFSTLFPRRRRARPPPPLPSTMETPLSPSSSELSPSPLRPRPLSSFSVAGSSRRTSYAGSTAPIRSMRAPSMVVSELGAGTSLSLSRSPHLGAHCSLTLPLCSAPRLGRRRLRAQEAVPHGRAHLVRPRSRPRAESHDPFD